MEEDIKKLSAADMHIVKAMNLIKGCQACRQNSIILTKLEESTMWIFNRIKELQINGDSVNN